MASATKNSRSSDLGHQYPRPSQLCGARRFREICRTAINSWTHTIIFIPLNRIGGRRSYGPGPLHVKARMVDYDLRPARAGERYGTPSMGTTSNLAFLRGSPPPQDFAR